MSETKTTTRDMLIDHTREMVGAAMGYVLAKLAEDPGWLHRMPLHGSLHDAVAPDAEAFMNARGNIAVDFLINDLKEVTDVER
jgi:hypothetical protein